MFYLIVIVIVNFVLQLCLRSVLLSLRSIPFIDLIVSNTSSFVIVTQRSDLLWMWLFTGGLRAVFYWIFSSQSPQLLFCDFCFLIPRSNGFFYCYCIAYSKTFCPSYPHHNPHIPKNCEFRHANTKNPILWTLHFLFTAVINQPTVHTHNISGHFQFTLTR